MRVLHADSALAAQLEGAVAADFEAYAIVASRLFPEDRPQHIEVGGGGAYYFGPGSPLNQAVAMGLSGPCSPGSVETVREFFEELGTPPVVLACPLAHESLFAQLAMGEWLVADFENVLGLVLDDVAQDGKDPRALGGDGPVDVRIASNEEDRALWTALSLEGFRGDLPSEDAFEHIAAIMGAREDVRLLIAEIDGVPAGTAAVSFAGHLAWLFADSTIPAMRGRGVQRALQRVRLSMACEAGCELAITEAKPGGVSQRNMERAGFRVLYTRVEFGVAPRSVPTSAEDAA